MIPTVARSVAKSPPSMRLPTSPSTVSSPSCPSKRDSALQPRNDARPPSGVPPVSVNAVPVRSPARMFARA